MALAIRLSRRNIEENTGGPFGAAVFDQHGALVSMGVNLVVSSHDSTAHAEMIALRIAQQRVANFDLGGTHELYTSAQPCIQCWGSCFWSGLRKLYYAARGSDVEKLTIFEEGPVPQNWAELLLQEKGIEVVHDFLSDDALPVLEAYKGPNYNGAVAT